MPKQKLSLLITLILLFLNSNSFSEQVKGMITSTRTWTKENSPYVVTDDITVIEGVSLTIEPGVVVQFNYEKALIIFGELIAAGNQAEPIVFTANHENPNQSWWGGIIFKPTSVNAVVNKRDQYVSGSIISYAIIEWAGNKYINGSDDCHQAAIWALGSSPYIANCNIKNISLEQTDGFCGITTRGAVSNCTIENFNSTTSFIGILCGGKATSNTIKNISSSDGFIGIRASGDAIHNEISRINNDYAEAYGIESEGNVIGNSIENFHSSEENIFGIYCKGKADSNKINILEGSSGYAIKTESSAKNNVITEVYFRIRYSERFGIYANGLVFNNIVQNTLYYDESDPYSDSEFSSPIGIFSKAGIFMNEVQKMVIGIKATEVCPVVGNKIKDCDTGIELSGNGSITGNIIIQCGTGITNEGNSDIFYNTITKNNIGLKFGGGIVKNNAIYDNVKYNFFLNISQDIDIANNYWKLNNDDEIYSLIFDYYKDDSKGKVKFKPFLLDQPTQEEVFNYIRKKWLGSN